MPADKKPETASPWTPEMTKAVIDSVLTGVAPIADRYMTLKEKEFDHQVALEKTTSRAAWWVLAVFLLFLAAITTLMVVLVFVDKVSGDALLFLVGTMAGYVFAIVQRHLFPETIEIQPSG